MQGVPGESQFTERETEYISVLTYYKQQATDEGMYLDLSTMIIMTRKDALEKGYSVVDPDAITGPFDVLRDWFGGLADEVTTYRDKLIVQAGSLSQLPADVVLNIMRFLPPKSVRSLCIVDRQLAQLCSDERLWSALVRGRYPNVVKPEDIKWRDFSYMLEDGVHTINVSYVVSANALRQYKSNARGLHPTEVGDEFTDALSVRAPVVIYGMPKFIYVMVVVERRGEERKFQFINLSNNAKIADDRLQRQVTGMGFSLNDYLNVSEALSPALTSESTVISRSELDRFAFVVGRLVVDYTVDKLRYVRNPLSGRWIKVKGTTWYRAVREYPELENDPGVSAEQMRNM